MAETVDEHLRQANAAHAAGRLAEAEEAAALALTQDPEHAPTHLLLGVLAAKTDRPDLALEHLGKVIAANPDSLEANFWLSILHRRKKQYSQAIEFAQKAARLRTGDAYVLNNLGLSYLEANRLDEAVKTLSEATTVRTDTPQIYHNLGVALYKLGRDIEAAKAFDKALALNPRALDSYLNLGQVMISMTNPEAAVACAQKAIGLSPTSSVAHLLMASALVEDSRTGEAESHLKRSIELDPQEPQAHALLGQRYQSLGRFEEANVHLRRSMELEPRQGFAYFAYVHNNKLTEADWPTVDVMERLVSDGDLPPREMNFLEYGLGRSYECLGEYEKAIQHYDSANRLARKVKFGDAVFDRDAHAAHFDWLIKTFNKSFFANPRPGVSNSDLPIVIVGMMRSGTTLAEQMLSSHPQVGPAGEQRFWPLRRPIYFGQDGQTVNEGVLSGMGAEYVATLKRIAPGFDNVTDKMPANYEFLGVIHAALPNARIIHMRRNPVDTCISIYATPNRVPVEFAYDRENIVFAYRQYQRLMDHWRAVLPAGRFLEVNYEDLVADRRDQIQRMLDFVGLPWSDSVMAHESNERNVNTPSLWQVRQPIYSSSVERWRRYEPWLGAFRDLL